MKFLVALALLTIAAGGAQDTRQPDTGQPFRLEPGDFRWIPFTVRQTPTAVDCRFDVVSGNGSVHLELLPMSEFRLFSRGRDHDTLAVTPDGRSGEFRRIVDTRGQYAVVVKNAGDAPPVSVRLRIETRINPGADAARTLTPRRRFTVVLLSLAFFFVAAAWSGRKLLRAIRA